MPDSLKPSPLFLAALSLAAGLLASFSMAPYNSWLLLFVGLGALYWSITTAKSSVTALLCGYLFAFGYFLLSLKWIGNALLVEGNDYAWAWPLAVCGLPLILAPFNALACFVSKRFFDLKSLPGFFAFTAALASAEWLRGHLFTGFPWNLYGYTWVELKEIAQVAALGNIYHLTWLTIMWAAASGFVIVGTHKKHKVFLSLAVLTSFALCFSFGLYRTKTYQPEFYEDIALKLVQPSITQDEKWNREKMTEHFFKYVRLSYPVDNSEKTTYVIWPETALHYLYQKDKSYMGVLTQALESYPGDAYLLSGTLQRDEDGSYHNALYLFDDQGQVINQYSKSHLVPFGEYIPFQRWIPLAPVAQFTGFQGGPKPQTQSLPGGLTYLPLICYEIIFPALSRPNGDAPDFIVNVTNDAWYGFSAGPHQHFTQAVFRAIETGIPVVRVANTGISAVIDPLGQVHNQTTLFEEQTEMAALPKKNTLFQKPMFFENITFAFLIFFIFGISILKTPNKY